MNKDFVSFPIAGIHRLKEQMLSWADRFNICSFLDNHQYHFGHHDYECLAGIGSLHTIAAPAGNALLQFDRFRAAHPGWLFGHLGYDLKAETEPPHTPQPPKAGDGPAPPLGGWGVADSLGFPDLFFCVPEIVLLLSDTELAIASYGGRKPAEIFEQIRAVDLPGESGWTGNVDIQSRFSQTDYIDTVERLRGHILRGDCYEVNFCQEFFAEGVSLHPLEVYHSLGLVSPNPFGAYYKLGDKYLLCASPERYLKKEGDRILSQPIKGTWERNTLSPELDEQNRRQLLQSPKDRSENVMVVDLVRNDLSRVCREGTVTVEELFGIYSFPQVHQMISTVSGRLRENAAFSDIIKASFPMGSMTGAPKKKVMELVDRYERSRRGLFSGAVGYMTPDGDFDFNVVIRSILYNQSNRYLSYQAGSAITFYSNAEQEYGECLLKVAAIKKVLASASTRTI